MPRGSYVTCQEAKRMKELRGQGLSARAVGRIVGRPFSTVLYIERRQLQTSAMQALRSAHVI